MDNSFTQNRSDEYYMSIALGEAQKAYNNGDVPIGAIITRGDTIVGRGYNMIEKLQDATAHAEVIAIGAASQKVESWRLHECTLFVTLEPCLMCIGASLQSRVNRIVFGASDSRFGAVTTHNHKEEALEAYKRWPEIIGGILEEDCREIIQNFFKEIRERNKNTKKKKKQKEWNF